MVSDERAHEVARILADVRSWAARQPTIRALAVAGSWAHNRARMDSDVDLVALCADPELYLGDGAWSREFAPDAVPMDTRSWGPLTERRFILRSRLEIDFGVAPLSWAGLDPIDDGTRAVVLDGITILHDPDLLLTHLIAACAPSTS
jgi:hypothetical protein